MMRREGILFICLFLMVGLVAAGEEKDSFLSQFAEPELHGFWEFRGGYRLQNDRYEKDMSVMESRLQLDLSTYNDWADFKYKGDFYWDQVIEDFEYDTREAWMFFRPTDWLDVKLGRQILTWGTGDLLFINDLFPKDWQSFFIGRDVEYLKAPSDAVKFSFFHDWANLDVVYTPQFDPDRYITGEYNSYWNSNMLSLAGRNAMVNAEEPDDWFSDDEIALRFYKNISNYEYAVYFYDGFWKSPGGQDSMMRAIFPDLRVYGASVRGNIGKGIGNVEIGYYQSLDDESGDNALINNSQMRYLVGYTQEIARELTAGVQYYVEQMLDYGAYKDNLPSPTPAQDEFRHVLTLRLTKLLMNQNLTVSFFGYYSPSDEDAYLRPNVNYKVSDNMTVETGANIFFGSDSHTFFNQFQDNTNLYAAIRYSF